MKIKKFEELECWQEARRMCRSIYSYTRRPIFEKDFRLSGQMRGAAISVINNISEGFDCLFQTACFARGDKRNDGSTFVLLSFRLWRKSKPPAMRVVVDSKSNKEFVRYLAY